MPGVILEQTAPQTGFARVVTAGRMQESDIALESSICTGETVIGFRSKTDGRLLNAVAVRNRADIAAFYRSYGFSYTGKFDK